MLVYFLCRINSYSFLHDQCYVIPSEDLIIQLWFMLYCIDTLVIFIAGTSTILVLLEQFFPSWEISLTLESCNLLACLFAWILTSGHYMLTQLPLIFNLQAADSLLICFVLLRYLHSNNLSRSTPPELGNMTKLSYL